MLDNLYGRTIKEQALSTAILFGCDPADFDTVWENMQGYSLPLTPKSFVYQVITAMEPLGIKIDESLISTAAARL